MSKIIAVVNQKGGVGKTTTAVSLSACLAEAKYPTLLIDIDPQANSTSNLGFDSRKLQKSIYEVLIEELDVNQAILKTELSYLELVPSTPQLVGAEIELVSVLARENYLGKALQELKKVYKYILIDCPPSLGLLTVNALTAAKSVLIPVQCEYFALEGLGQLISTIQLIRKHLNDKLKLEGVLLTMYDGRLNLSKLVVDEVKKNFKDKVFSTIINRNVRLSETPSFGKPIILYNASSRGSEDYRSLAAEIIKTDGVI